MTQKYVVCEKSVYLCLLFLARSYSPLSGTELSGPAILFLVTQLIYAQNTAPIITVVRCFFFEITFYKEMYLPSPTEKLSSQFV
jgi:hypothetical protein